jgi:hypothetical protein
VKLGWSLTLREEGVRGFQNRVLRKIFGHKKEEVSNRRRENFIMRSFMICTPRQIIQVIKSWRMRWAGNVARMAKKLNAYRVLVRKPEGTRSLWKLRHRQEDSTEMDLGKKNWRAWTGLIWLRRGTSGVLL